MIRSFVLALIDRDRHLGDETVAEYDMPMRVGDHKIDTLHMKHRGRTYEVILSAQVKRL